MQHFQNRGIQNQPRQINCNNLKKNNLKMMFSMPTAILTTNIKQITYKVGNFTIKVKLKFKKIWFCFC
jgi:hypothetical protein